MRCRASRKSIPAIGIRAILDPSLYQSVADVDLGLLIVISSAISKDLNRDNRRQ